jgi:very-short-patch-repair endonuclease
MESKSCQRCGKPFTRNKKYSAKQWDSARWCSRKCSTWNQGLTKHDDPRMAKIAETMREAMTGRPGWSKGMTKDTHPSLMIVSQKVSATQKGRPATETQLRSLAKGHGWWKGKTKETCPELAAKAARLSELYAGRSNPAHSKRMKEFYRANPSKHPNAILAKKTKGRGYTQIERIVARMLGSLGLAYNYNVRIGSKWPDFSIPEHSLIVEADGERWHQDKVKEAERDAHLEALGWTVLHLTETEILMQPADCKNRIRAAVGQHVRCVRSSDRGIRCAS